MLLEGMQLQKVSAEEVSRMNIVTLPISEAQIGDIIYTNGLVDDWYAFVIKRIERETEGGSDKWGRVFYDHKNNFITERAIAKRWGILGNSEERQGFVIRVRGVKDNEQEVKDFILPHSS